MYELDARSSVIEISVPPFMVTIFPSTIEVFNKTHPHRTKYCSVVNTRYNSNALLITNYFLSNFDSNFLISLK